MAPLLDSWQDTVATVARATGRSQWPCTNGIANSQAKSDQNFFCSKKHGNTLMTKLYNIGDEITAVKNGKLVEGVVVYWRSKYGGKVQYTVKLSKPVQYRWRPSEDIYTVLVNDDQVICEEII